MKNTMRLGLWVLMIVAFLAGMAPVCGAEAPEIDSVKVNLAKANVKVLKKQHTICSYRCYEVTDYEMGPPSICAKKWVAFASYTKDDTCQIRLLDLGTGKTTQYPLVKPDRFVTDVYANAANLYWIEYDTETNGWALIMCARSSRDCKVIRQRPASKNAQSIPRLVMDGDVLVWMEGARTPSGATEFFVYQYNTADGTIKQIASRNTYLNTTVKVEACNGYVSFPDEIDGQWAIRCFDLDLGRETKRFLFGNKIPDDVCYDGEYLGFNILRDESWSQGAQYIMNARSGKVFSLGSKNDGWINQAHSGKLLCQRVFLSSKEPLLYNEATNHVSGFSRPRRHGSRLDLFAGSVDKTQIAFTGVYQKRPKGKTNNEVLVVYTMK